MPDRPTSPTSVTIVVHLDVAEDDFAVHWAGAIGEPQPDPFLAVGVLRAAVGDLTHRHPGVNSAEALEHVLATYPVTARAGRELEATA